MNEPCVVALGFFDGVHLAHGALLDLTCQRAEFYGVQSAAISFDLHPDNLLHPGRTLLLNTADERTLLMKKRHHIDRVELVHFDRVMMEMPWDAFLETYLLGRLHACHVVCGHDFRFGFRGEGTAEKLKNRCEALGVGCDIVPCVTLNGVPVSSTCIRSLLAEGNCRQATEFLGHGHLISGVVEQGFGRGAGIGFPTANLSLSEEVLVPAKGVYLAKALLNGHWYRACVNIGVHPTVGALDAPIAESWLEGIDRPLYGEKLAIFLQDRLRGEMAFDSLDALQTQIRRDTACVLAWDTENPW